MTDSDTFRGRPAWVRTCHSAAPLVLAALAVVAALHLLRPVLMPVVLATFLALLLARPVEALREAGLPRAASAGVVTLLATAAAVLVVAVSWRPAVDWLEEAPRTVRALERHATPLLRIARRVDAVADRVTGLAPPSAARTAVASSPTVSSRLVTALPQVAVTAVTVTVLTFLLLWEGPRLLGEGTRRSRSPAVRRRLELFAAAREGLGRYFGVLALINVGLGLATATLAALVGLPNPLLWGAVAAVLNFVPYVGPAVTLLLLGAAALLAFETLGPVLALVAGFLALTTVEGQIVQPWLVGRRAQISPLLVFLAIWAGGWLWGIAGMLLAAPTLVVVQAMRSAGATPVVTPPVPTIPMAAGSR